VSQPQADLVTFENTFGLPHVPWTTITVGGGSSDTSGNDEWDLDTQYITGMAPNVSSLLVYAGVSLSNADIAAVMNRWVTDDRASVGNFSAGECELLAQVSGFQTAGDQILAQAAAQGQTLFNSSGDTGSQCAALVGVNGVPLGAPGVEYPSASPYVVSVGGTTLINGPSVAKEAAWYAGGGGQSLFENEPSWQSGVGGSNLGVLRGVPDVALDADPTTGYTVIVNGSQTTIGGTSASSPAWAGIWARAQSAHGGTLGFAAPTIYREAAASFFDVVLGTNGIYPATPGYDYTTGRGTPDIQAFVAGA
jgi:pseudomonalisin/xanthomonalisin